MNKNKQILVAREKRGTRYFDASTPELLAESAFKLLKERWEDEIYWREDQPYAEDILSEEQIAALPTESLRNAESRKRKDYLRKLYNWQDDQKEYLAIKDCVENNRIDKAWKLLNGRSDYEYESVELETLE